MCTAGGSKCKHNETISYQHFNIYNAFPEQRFLLTKKDIFSFSQLRGKYPRGHGFTSSELSCEITTLPHPLHTLLLTYYSKQVMSKTLFLGCPVCQVHPNKVGEATLFTSPIEQRLCYAKHTTDSDLQLLIYKKNAI